MLELEEYNSSNSSNPSPDTQLSNLMVKLSVGKRNTGVGGV